MTYFQIVFAAAGRAFAGRVLAIALGLAAALGASSVAAEVIAEAPGGFVTREVSYVKTSPYETWQALTAPKYWWDDRSTWSGDADNLYISPIADGCFCEKLDDPGNRPSGVLRGSAMHMTVLQANPPMVLRMRGALGPLQSEPVDGVLTITLKPEGSGTRILWEYAVGGYMRYGTEKIARVTDGMLKQQLTRLTDYLGPMSPPPGAEPAPGDSASSRADEAPEDDSAPDGKPDAPAGDATVAGADGA